MKSDHVGDLRDTVVKTPIPKPLSGRNDHDDRFQFADFATSINISSDYLNQIQLDPDGILSEEERELFDKLHQRFASLFTPQPGKYNGAYGFIDNSLQFSSLPPPNNKTRVPN